MEAFNAYIYKYVYYIYICTFVLNIFILILVTGKCIKISAIVYIYLCKKIGIFMQQGCLTH